MSVLARPLIRIHTAHELWGIIFLWCYDIVKYAVLKDLIEAQGIDPLIFLFFDMVTVPPFIIGSARLVNSLAGEVLAWPRVLGWGGTVLINTVLPYVYAAVAGGSRFTTSVWVIFWLMIVLVLANLIRTIRSRVIRSRLADSQGKGD